MYARVLRKWSLHTKPQMSIIMWRLLLLTLLLLCLCASSVTCKATTITSTSITDPNSMSVSRRSTAAVPAPAIASASMPKMTANAPAIEMSTDRASAAAGAAAPLQHPSSPLPLSLRAVPTPPAPAAAAATVGDIIEESYYIPVDGDDADSNIYDSRLVQALDVGSVLRGGIRGNEGAAGAAVVGVSNKNSWRISNSYNSGSSSISSSGRLFSSRSNLVSSSSKSGRQEQQQVQQREQEHRDRQASATFADNMAYAYYRRAAPPTLHISPKLTQTSTETKTTTINAAPQTVFSPQFSVQHVANDENVAVDDDDEHEDEERAEDEEEEEELVSVDDADANVDGDEHASHEDDADDGHTQQQKVPNNKNSHIINLFKAYKNNNKSNNRYYNSNIIYKPHQQQHPYAAANTQQLVFTNSVGDEAHVPDRRSTKARRHVSVEQRQHRTSLQQQQQQHRMALHHAATAPPTPPSTSSTSLPISQYPTKKVFQLVNGKNLTRIVHLLPPTHYRIAAYEIPSSLPYRGELSEQQQRMLQHQREQQQHQLQLQQDQAARSRRDSRLFGIAQATGYYSVQQQTPHVSALGQQSNAQQQFQRLQQSNSASSSGSWQQISGSIFQRQPVYQQRQRQQQQQHLHNHQHSASDSSFGSNSNHRAAHNHNHKHNSNSNNYNKHNQRQRQHKRSRRYCSARDPAQLAFEAPIVFEGKITSMSPDRRHNFAATVQVLNAYKQQIGYQVKREQFVRLQFTYINSSGECDIYREQLRPRGLVRGDELELQRTYLFFVQQIDMRNFTILGQPIRKTRRVVEAVKDAVSENYAQLASIRTITTNRTMEIGKELHIVCKVQGRPPPKVTWFKDGKSINRNRKLYKFRHFKKRSELIIRSFNISDTGRYECRAKNKINQEPDRRTILIKADPEPRYPTSLTGGTGNVCPDDAAEFCLNGGTCNFFSEIGSYSCICPEGFMGERCDRKEVNNISPSTYSNEQECGEKKFYGSYYC